MPDGIAPTQPEMITIIAGILNNIFARTNGDNWQKGGERARRAVLKRVGRFNRVMGGDHKLERADPMVQCEVQAHKSTALEFNQHLVGAIFHMIRYARYFDRKRRFSADIARAKSISRLDL